MAIKANLVIDQGTDFVQIIDVTDLDDNPIDLSGYTGAAQIRKTYSSDAYKEFLVVTSGNGSVQLTLNAANTDALTAGQYVWDCELTSLNTGAITRIVEGIVTITPSVTR